MEALEHPVVFVIVATFAAFTATTYGLLAAHMIRTAIRVSRDKRRTEALA